MESLQLKIYRKLEAWILENIKTAPHWSDQTRLVMVSREIFSPLKTTIKSASCYFDKYYAPLWATDICYL